MNDTENKTAETIKINEWTLTKINDSSEPMIPDLELATRLVLIWPCTEPLK